jgi:hypothetical protein
MHYDGSSFTLTQVPFVVPASTQGQTFGKIEAIAPNDVWAIGSRHGLSTPAVATGAPLLFHWDGSQWTPSSPITTTAVFADIAALGPNDVWILGYHTPSPGVATPFMIRWDGSTWSPMPAPPGGSSLKVFAPNDVYAGGSSVWHFDGASWTEVQSFPTLSSPTFVTIDGVAPCQLWGGGGQWVIGQAVPFVVRQDTVYWEASQRAGCLAGSTPGLISALTAPRLGTFFTIGVSDPAGALPLTGGTGLTWWVVSAGQLSSGGCGLPLPGLGPVGGPGELLIDLAASLLELGPYVWSGGAAVSQHTAFIPDVPQLAGVQVYSQGALLDTFNLSHAILTPALDFQVGY